MKNLWRWFVYIVLIGGGMAFVGWQLRSQPPAVTAARVETAPLTAEWSAVGYVECRTANVSAPQVGRIVEVTVREGDSVAVGQPLARLESSAETAGVAVQQAGGRAAAAQGKAAQAALREYERLQRDRVARAEAEVEAARARWEQSVAALTHSRKAARANLAAMEAAASASRAELANLQQGGRPEEIIQAQAEVSAAEAGAVQARTEAARQASLFQQDAVSRKAVEEADEALVRAESALRGRRAALDLLRQGARPERIAAARARQRAAEAQREVAESEIAGLKVDERRVQESAAALRAARAAEAEARSGAAHIDVLRYKSLGAQARMHQSEAAVRQARAIYTQRLLTAPFAGWVGRRFVDPGDLASPSQPLFSIVEADQVWVVAEVDEQDLAPVQEGQQVSITAPAYVGREFLGKVARIGGEAIPQTEVRTGARIVRVRVALEPTPTGMRRMLKPGMEVHIAGRTTLAKKATLIPSDALLTDSAGSYVWVIEAQQVRIRRVRAGYSSGLQTEILEGLQQGERVVLSGKEGLKEGSRVTAQETP